jgi:hypothetical protein
MARLANTASDKQTSALEKTSDLMQNITITTNPVVITAVQRKANIGNFETIDIYMGVAMPQSLLDVTDAASMEKALTEAAEFGFSVAAKETGKRYHVIKDSLKSQ